jgi:hypothetical protein
MFAVYCANKKGDYRNATNNNAIQPVAIFIHLISPLFSVLHQFSRFGTGQSSCLKGVAYV